MLYYLLLQKPALSQNKIKFNLIFKIIFQEAEELMAALDRDKSGQVSYAEFCFAQKNLSNLSALAEKALSKLTGIMILQKNEREKLLAESEENYSRLIHEKETLVCSNFK